MACSCNLLKPALPLNSSNPSNFLGLCQHARQKALHVLGTRQVLRSCLARTKKKAKQHPSLFLCIYLSNSIYPDTYHTMICTHMYIIYIYVCVWHITSIHPQEISPSQAPDVFSAGSPRHPARARPPWSPTSWETRGRCPSLTRRLRRLCYGGKISPHWTNGYLWRVKGG